MFLSNNFYTTMKSNNSFQQLKVKPSQSKSPIRALPSLLDKKSSSTSQFFKTKNSTKFLGKSSDFNSTKITKLTKEIFEAKCKDLMIASLRDQENRFSRNFQAGLSQRQLNFQESNVSFDTCEVLSKILPTANMFAYMNFSKNKLGDEGVLKLVSSIEMNLNIVSIDLSSTDISLSGSIEIMEALSKLQSLVFLDLSSHQFLYRNWLAANESLSKILKIPTLVYLNLSSTGLGNEGFKFVINGLRDNLVLKYLNLSSNKLRGAIFKEFALAATTSNLDELLLGCNKIDDIATEEICNLLSGFYGYSVLTRLGLGNNCIPNSAIHKLFEIMIRENYLLHLNLENNNFNGNLEVISRFLNENCRLKSLNLSFCCLKMETIFKLSEGLAKNKSLEILKISGNNCKNTGAEFIAQALASNKFLKSLDLSSNYIRNEGGIALATSLTFNKSINVLLLSDNEFKDEVGNALLALFTHNFYIVKLKIDLNPINAKFIDDINVFLNRNKSYVHEMARKNAINLKKFVIENVPEEIKVENETSRKMNEFFNDIENKEKDDEEKIKEVSKTSIEKIKEIKFDLNKMYSFEDLRKANKKFLKKETNEKSEIYIERKLIGIKVDNCKKIEKVYQDLIKQVSNLENKDSQTFVKIKKKLKNKSKLPKVFIYSRISAKTPELDHPDINFKGKKRLTRSKSPVLSKFNI